MNRNAVRRPAYAAWYVDILDYLLAQRPHNHVIDENLEARALDFDEGLDYYEAEALT